MNYKVAYDVVIASGCILGGTFGLAKGLFHGNIRMNNYQYYIDYSKRMYIIPFTFGDYIIYVLKCGMVGTLEGSLVFGLFPLSLLKIYYDHGSITKYLQYRWNPYE